MISSPFIKSMKVLSSILVVYIALLIFLYFLQEKLMFFPDERSCKDIKSAAFEGENIRFIERVYPNATATLIHFHGNAGGVCDRSFVLENLKHLPINIVLAEYPGYSGDNEFPTLKKIKENSLKLLKYFKKNGGPIFLYGESLGSTLATYLSTLEKVDGLILQSPFPSLGDVGQSAYPIFPVKWLVRDDFSIKKSSTKALVLIAEEDEIIPTKLSEKQTKIFENVKMFKFENRNHNNLVVENQKLWDEVADFLGSK